MVNITSPTSGSAVRGAITVSADVTITGQLTVAGVQFKLDGANLGLEDTAPPYSVPWDTTTASNASHTLTAVARDLLGLQYTSNPVTVTVDNVPPTVTINQSTGQADPTNASPINFTVAFSEPVTGFTAADVTIAGTAAGTKTVTVAGGPMAYDVAVSGMTSGTVTATIAAAMALDAVGNGNTASTSTDNTVTFDITAPVVTINQATGQVDPTNASSINFTAIFSEPVSDFTASDVTVTGTAGATKTITVTGGPSAYNVAVSGMTDGTVIATIASGVARDVVGNGNAASTSTDNTVTFDGTVPTVTINQAAGQLDPTNTSPINFTAIFSEPVTGFTPADVTISGTAAGTKTVTVTGGPSAYNVAVSGMTDGTVIATILAGAARDGADNSNTASTSSDNTVTFNAPDTTAPSVTINQAGSQADPTSSAPIVFTAVFSEAVSGFSDSDVAVGGTAGGTTTVSVSGGPSSYTVAVSGMTTSGTVIATIPAGAARDGADNSNTASTSTDNSVTFSAPDTMPPTVAITSPASGETVSGTIMMRADASDNVGVASVEFLVDGATFGTDTTAPYEVPWDTTTAADNSSPTLTARARDTAGNTTMSAPVTVTVFNAAPPDLQTATRFEETDLATGYTVGWVHYFADRPFSGGTAAVSPKTDGRATFSFVGTSVKWIGFRGPQTGIALVFLDGSLVAEVDTYSPTEEVKAIIFSAEELAYGSHQLWIEVTGLKNPAAWDSAVIVDAFDVAPAMPPPTFTSGKRVQETAASYTGGWTRGDPTTAWSGGTAAVANTAGAQATFTFTGTSVNWIGFRGPSSGIARVFLDGTLHGTVDLYEPFALQAVVFTASGLEDTSHTMVIEATGLSNSASTDAVVAVDAFDTRARFEETHSSINYTETWEVTVSRAWSEKTAVFTWVTDAHAIFRFTGTSVRWIGYRGPLGGIARVYLDGVFVGDIDTYAADETHQAILYEATGLASGSHVLTIVNTGQMNPLSRTPYVSVDAFDINFTQP